MLANKTDEQMGQLGLSMLKNIIEAQIKVDYGQFCGDFSPSHKQRLTQEVFEESAKQHSLPLGEVSSIDYLGHLQRDFNQARQLLYKVRFAEASEDTLYNLFLVDINGQIEVDCLGIDGEISSGV